jgi:type II secretion system protein G
LAYGKILSNMWARQKAFTIVELLIVIVVIGILAAISLVAYTNVQNRAYASERRAELASVAKALELYYTDNGRYPASAWPSSQYECLSAVHWNCWGAGTANQLIGRQYIAQMPQDPQPADVNAYGLPNSYQTRLYAYVVSTDFSRYSLGTYIPGLSSSDPNYVDGSANRSLLNFANYIITSNR